MAPLLCENWGCIMGYTSFPFMQHSGSSDEERPLLSEVEAASSSIHGESFTSSSTTSFYQVNPTRLDSVQLETVRRTEAALRNRGLLRPQQQANLRFVRASDGCELALAHRVTLFLHSPYLRRGLESAGDDLEAFIVDESEVSSEAYQKVINYLYLPDSERSAYLERELSAFVDDVRQLAVEWELDELADLLDGVATQRGLVRAYQRLEEGGIVIPESEHGPTFRQRIGGAMGSGLAVLIGAWLSYGHYHSTYSGAEEATEGIHDTSLATTLLWLLVVGGMLLHFIKNVYYQDKFVSDLFDKQLTGAPESLLGSSIGSALDSQTCTSRRVADVAHRVGAVGLGALGAVPDFYKFFVTNSALDGWFHYFVAGSTTALGVPDKILNYHLMLRQLREALSNPRELPEHLQRALGTLREALAELVAQEKHTGGRWVSMLKKAKHWTSILVLFPTHMIIKVLYAYLAYTAISPVPVAVLLTILNVTSDLYFKLFFPIGKIKEPHLLSMKKRRVVRWTRNSAIAVLPFLSWTSSLTNVDKTVGVILNRLSVADPNKVLIPLKVLDSLYEVSFHYGCLPPMTRRGVQQAAVLANPETREKDYLYRTLRRSIRYVEETKHRQEPLVLEPLL